MQLKLWPLAYTKHILQDKIIGAQTELHKTENTLCTSLTKHIYNLSSQL